MQRKFSLKRRQVSGRIGQSAEHAQFHSSQERFGCPKAQTNLHNMFRCCCAHDLIPPNWLSPLMRPREHFALGSGAVRRDSGGSLRRHFNNGKTDYGRNIRPSGNWGLTTWTDWYRVYLSVQVEKEPLHVSSAASTFHPR